MVRKCWFVLEANKTRMLLLLLLGALASPGSAQVQLGTPKYGSFGGGPVDTINLANLNAHIVIPIFHKPGRGLPFDYDITYDTTIWEPVPSGSTKAWSPVSGLGWNGSAINVGSIASARGYDGRYWYTCDTTYIDGFGTAHSFTGGNSDGILWGCALYDTSTNTDYPFSSIANDGSGYTFTADLCYSWPYGLCQIAFDSQDLPLAVESLTATNGNGIIPQGAYPTTVGVSSGSVLDRNGNEITAASGGQFKDTLGLTALTITGGSPDPYVMTYTDPNGHPASATVTFKSYTVQTNFECVPAVSEYGPAVIALVDRVTLPNSTYYQFAYEATPGYPGNVTARVASITLPTGGTISYSYTGGNNGIVCADGTTAGIKRYTPDTGSNYWKYDRTAGTGAAYTTTITDPSSSNNQTLIQFQGIYETERQVYQGSSSSGTLLETINTCYNTLNPTFPCNSTAVSLPITERAIQTQLGTLYSEHNYFYNSSYGMLSEVDDYDWGSSPKGALLKKTLYAYALNLGKIKSFAQTVTVCTATGSSPSCGTSGGTQVAQTTYNYDERVPISTSGIPQHINPLAGTSRGNLTSVQKWLNTTGALLTTQNVYLDTGKLAATADPNNNVTNYTYSGSFGGAYLTKVTNALGQVVTNNYDPNTGVLISTTDPNGQVTAFAYDNMLRPTQTNFPDGGQTAACYTDEGGSCSQTGPPYSIVGTRKVTGSSNAVSTAKTDTQGRVSQTQLNSDPSGVDYTDTSYDTLGRVGFVSNPYRSSGDPTYGITCFGTVSGGVCQENGYDAIGRITSITDQDGSILTASYSNNCTTATDEAGKARKSCADSLGRITGIWEDPNGLNYETDYSYDVLGDLVQVVQKGSSPSRTRTYTYDSLARVVCAADPEIYIATCPATSNGTYTTGTVGYSYDANGNVTTKTAPQPNQYTASTTVVTTYTYDALNRLTQRSYNPNTTPPVSYFYDGNPPSGCSVASFAFGSTAIGRLTSMCDGGGGTGGAQALLYDSMGRILSDQRTTNSVTKTTSYTYNVDGTIATIAYPSGSTIAYATNAAEQPTSVTDVTNNINYVASAVYAPFGGLASLSNSSASNPILTTAYYNKRLQPCRFAVNANHTASPSSCTDTNVGSVLDQIYNFNLCNSNSADNGYVCKVSDTRSGMSARNANYTYDSLNRISSGYTDLSSGQYCWGETYTIDAWSNVTAVAAKSGYSGCGYDNFSQGTSSSQNQFPSICSAGNCYDVSGNLLSDMSNGLGNTYLYDAEAHVCSTNNGSSCTTPGSGTVYTYDGDGRRVQKSGTNALLYWYDTGNHVLDETDSSGNIKNEYIFFNGKRIARRQIR
jgi:YD repeat-containing protein